MLQKYFLPNLIEAGTDEAGRGCLSGSVVAAAVILPVDFECKALNDSKKLTEKKRNELRLYIEQHALSYGVAFVEVSVIDQINILQSSILAMHKAIAKLQLTPAHIIVDGNKFNPYKDIPHTTVIKGDAKYMSIAAASILAKTYRDEYMSKLSEEFPMYKWSQNKGYPTKQHREAIRTYGITPYHRKSFRLLPEQYCRL